MQEKLRHPAVFEPRHAAEHLTGCRLEVTRSPVTAHMPLPTSESPSLGHVAVLVDVAAGQALEQLEQTRKQAFRTVSVNVHLQETLTPGDWLRGVGTVDFVGGSSAVTSCQVFSSTDSVVASGTCRFMAVDGASSGGAVRIPSVLDINDVPQAWSQAFGLSEPDMYDGNTVFRVSPDRRSANGAGSMHGGLQGRLLDLGMRSGLSFPDTNILGDLHLSFSRTVPLLGINRDSGDVAPAHDGVWPALMLRTTTRHRGRRVSFAAAELTNKAGAMLSHAEGTYFADWQL